MGGQCMRRTGRIVERVDVHGYFLQRRQGMEQGMPDGLGDLVAFQGGSCASTVICSSQCCQCPSQRIRISVDCQYAGDSHGSMFNQPGYFRISRIH